ncbi:MAG TPA: hypothetical protein VHX63_10085 [Acidobacteriaceae bacterium]|nr:hypothetical protein [Acidobacteriaceae bacterium]
MPLPLPYAPIIPPNPSNSKLTHTLQGAAQQGMGVLGGAIPDKVREEALAKVAAA